MFDYERDRSEKPSSRSHALPLEERFLFNELMTVRIKSHEREEYETGLRLQIQSRNEKGQSMLSILLTDDTNPYPLPHSASSCGPSSSRRWTS